VIQIDAIMISFALAGDILKRASRQMKRKMEIVAIVQARVGSTRLPSKVLMEIAGKPLLEHVVDRSMLAEKLDQIVIATSTKEQDRPIIDLAKRLDVGWFAGSEDDVLSRYLGAAEQARADVIVRITADCPLIDPSIVDYVVTHHLRGNFGYTCNLIDEANPKSFPRGLDTEVFTIDALRKSDKLAKKAYEREHVTPFMQEHPELFRIAIIEAPENYRRHYRLTVDTCDDLRLIREIYRHLYTGTEIIQTKDVIRLLDEHPELQQINAHVKQKHPELA
jgi:spore coat polysaccharide biosynthesis protein SpsF